MEPCARTLPLRARGCGLVPSARPHHHIEVVALRQAAAALHGAVIIAEYQRRGAAEAKLHHQHVVGFQGAADVARHRRSEEHTSELQSRENLVCRLLLEKKKKNIKYKI